MAGEIRKAAADFEDRFFAQQPIIEQTAQELYKKNPDSARAYINDYSNRAAQDVLDGWWKLADNLVVRYQDFGQSLPGSAGGRGGLPEGLARRGRLREDQDPATRSEGAGEVARDRNCPASSPSRSRVRERGAAGVPPLDPIIIFRNAPCYGSDSAVELSSVEGA